MAEANAVVAVFALVVRRSTKAGATGKFAEVERERERERERDQFLKKWSGLVKFANPNLSYLPQKDRDLNLPTLMLM